MRSVFRALFVLAVSVAVFSGVLAKDVDAKHAMRDLDDVFSKSDTKAREKIIGKLEGDTLDLAAAEAARAHALQLQREAPRKLPKLDEAFEGALDYQYEVVTRKTTYKTFALLDLPDGLAAPNSRSAIALPASQPPNQAARIAGTC